MSGSDDRLPGVAMVVALGMDTAATPVLCARALVRALAWLAVAARG